MMSLSNYRIIFFCKYILISLLIYSTNSICSPVTDTSKPFWELIGPGDADQVTSLSFGENNQVFLGTDIGGIYLSKDGGGHWESINHGLENHDITTPVISDITSPDILFVGTRGGLYKSNDGSNTWRNIREGLPTVKKYALSGSIGSIMQDPFDPSRLYLGMGYRPSFEGNATIKRLKWSSNLYVSNDKGESWRVLNAFNEPQRVNHLVHSLIEKSLLYAATSKGIYKSTNNGTIWRKIYSGEVLNILLFSEKENMIIASVADSGMIKSLDGGKTWARINNGLPYGFMNRHKNRYSVLTSNLKVPVTIYIINSTWGHSGGLYMTANYGESWQFISNDLPESWLKTSKRMNAVAVDTENKIYLGSSRYVYSSENNGATWKQLISKRLKNGWTNTGINVFGHTRIVKAAPDNKDIIYIGTADHGMVVSSNGGDSWSVIGDNLKYADNVWDVEVCKKKPESVFIIGSNIKGKLCMYNSNNRGSTWQSHCNNLGKTNRNEKIYVEPKLCKDIYVTTSKGIMKLDKYSWRHVGSGLPDGKVNYITSSLDKKNAIYAATDGGLYKSNGFSDAWEKLPGLDGVKVVSLLISNADSEVVFVGTGLTEKMPARIYRSDDGGRHWRVMLDNVRKYFSGFAQLPGDSNIIYASTNDYNYHDRSAGDGVYRSVDHGLTWLPYNLGLPVLKAFSISTSSSAPLSVYLSTQGSGAYVLEHK